MNRIPEGPRPVQGRRATHGGLIGSSKQFEGNMYWDCRGTDTKSQTRASRRCKNFVPACASASQTRQHRGQSTVRAKATAEFQRTGYEEVPMETDKNGMLRVKLNKEGWKYWEWRGNRINYITAGDKSKPPVVLVHGFGASAYHWRYIIPELAKKYAVYAVDLLGFGFSSKPSVVYNGYRIWSDQLADFTQEVVGGRPAVLVGNSMGAYASLLASAYHPEVVRGLVLVNGAGKFQEVKAAVEAQAEAGLESQAAKEAVREAVGVSSEMPDRDASSAPQSAPDVRESRAQEKNGFLKGVLEPVQTMAARVAIYVAFIAAKQPARIRKVLNQVYVSEDNIDGDLVDSIVLPAQDSNAPDVFYRVITSEGESINSLLQKLQAPLFLLWGELDPWITPASADKIQKIFPAAERVDVRGGHCPHDDVPQLFIPPLQRWLEAFP